MELDVHADLAPLRSGQQIGVLDLAQLRIHVRFHRQTPGEAEQRAHHHRDSDRPVSFHGASHSFEHPTTAEPGPRNSGAWPSPPPVETRTYRWPVRRSTRGPTRPGSLM